MSVHGHEHFVAFGLQEKFDERWQVCLIPKLAEEEVHMRDDAIAVRKQRLDNAQVGQALVTFLLHVVRGKHKSSCVSIQSCHQHGLFICTAM